jgi:hypothetical protein
MIIDIDRFDKRCKNSKIALERMKIYYIIIKTVNKYYLS